MKNISLNFENLRDFHFQDLQPQKKITKKAINLLFMR